MAIETGNGFVNPQLFGVTSRADMAGDLRERWRRQTPEPPDLTGIEATVRRRSRSERELRETVIAIIEGMAQAEPTADDADTTRGFRWTSGMTAAAAVAGAVASGAALALIL